MYMTVLIANEVDREEILTRLLVDDRLNIIYKRVNEVLNMIDDIEIIVDTSIDLFANTVLLVNIDDLPKHWRPHLIVDDDTDVDYIFDSILNMTSIGNIQKAVRELRMRMSVPIIPINELLTVVTCKFGLNVEQTEEV